VIARPKLAVRSISAFKGIAAAMDGVRDDLAPFALLETRALAAAVFDVQLSDRGRDPGCDISCFTRGAGGLSER
jgi:hypothetical protein